MAGPWEAYQDAPQADPSAGPWEAYQAQDDSPTFMKGLGRLIQNPSLIAQTTPGRIVSSLFSAATLPGEVAAGTAQVPQSANMPGGENTDSIGRVMDLAAAVSPVNPAITAGDRLIPGALKATRVEKPAVPTTRELAEAGAADIRAAKGSDLAITGASVADQSRRIQQGLFDAGVHPTLANNTFQILKELENVPPDSVFTPANLQTLRETLGGIAQNFNPNAAKDQLAATRAIRELDSFLPGLGPKDTMVRPAAAESAPATQEQIVAQSFAGQREAQRVADLFERGRGNYASAQRSNDITGELDRATTGILERAEARAQAANSGRNLDNTIRSKVASILEKPKEISGLDEAEIGALNHVLEGGPVRNAMRYVGNLFGGGGGAAQSTMAAMGGSIGGLVGGIPGAVVGAAAPTGVGAAAKTIANILAKRELSKVSELMRMRSPLYQERLDSAGTAVVSPEARAIIARALLMDEMRRANQP